MIDKKQPINPVHFSYEWGFILKNSCFNVRKYVTITSMKKFYAKRVGDEFIFEGDELAHFNVLRCNIGEEVLCLGDDGYDYTCQVFEITKKCAKARIVSRALNSKNPRVKISVFQGLVKGEKLDLIVQKLTELGMSELYTFESDFTIAKANSNKTERLIKISKEACKQCGRSIPIKINESISFKQMLNELKQYDLVLFANEKDTVRDVSLLKADSIALVIGSEGGFSDAEISAIKELGVKNFGMGSRILRAETAAIAMASIVGYLVEV